MPVDTFVPLPVHVNAVRQIVEARSSTPFCKDRHRRNVESPPQLFSREEFWFRMVTCICTSVQGAGPDGRLAQFVRETPFSLHLEICKSAPDLRSLAQRTLSEKGIRFGPTRGAWIEANLSRLDGGLWSIVEEYFYKLAQFPAGGSPEARVALERDAARAIAGRPLGLKGAGAKQARNIWQCMGVTQFEIPLDSRVCNWANSLTPALPIDAKRLYRSVPYYEEVMSRIQALCQAAGKLPCDFDAAVFSSFDSTE